MAASRSSTLFHFTKSPNILESILINGFYPRYSLEDISWLGSSKLRFIAYPIVCFCDIPLGRIIDHIGFYGDFGIGMTRDWAISNGLNPVTYISDTSLLSKSLNKCFDGLLKFKVKEGSDAYLKHSRCVVAYSKPLIGTMIVNGQPASKEFYHEYEWRYVAQHSEIPEYLHEGRIKDHEKLEKFNDLAAQKAKLEFTTKDVKYLFVKSDADIPDLVNFINVKLDKFPAADLKILTSRIISVDTIAKDI